MAKDDRGLDRLLKRASSRVISRTMHTLPETIQRIEERAAGPNLTRRPEQLEVIARRAVETAYQGQSMRSAIARELAELTTLSAEHGVLRAEELVARAADGDEEAAGGEGTPFQAWYDSMAAKGLTEPEIEQHMLQRLRSIRQKMLRLESIRSIGS